MLIHNKVFSAPSGAIHFNHEYFSGNEPSIFKATMTINHKIKTKEKNTFIPLLVTGDFLNNLINKMIQMKAHKPIVAAFKTPKVK